MVQSVVHFNRVYHTYLDNFCCSTTQYEVRFIFASSMGPSPFRFYNRWLEDKGLVKEAVKGWVDYKVSGSKGVIWVSKLKASKLSIKIWLSLKVGGTIVEVKIESEMVEGGNKNSKFFHLVANRRRRSNYIGDISFDRVRFSDPKDVKNGVLNYFKKHFKYFVDNRPRYRDLFPKQMSQVDKIWLEDSFSKDEVWEAVHSCDRNKAPSHDDSFIIEEEIIHKWKRQKDGGLLVKLDFEKGYDFVDQTFLDDMMANMGFGVQWRKWIKDFISSPVLLVIVNGSPPLFFKIERGLHQGDSLSSFLFNLVMEGKNVLLMRAHDLNLIKGVNFGNNEVHVSHLQFTNDIILFLEPNIEVLLKLKRVLSLLVEGSKTASILKEGLSVIVGKGNKAQLWKDIGWDSITLYRAFLRIYALAV
ncbi:hypothetical protein Ddye_011327 [Dipteronia dyeriana]|uniref:Reverse transcriptase domain-containing protein n=1 Tax=Dipteronia dyeriana TaxID=168575 RepID=A0AAD9X2C0_9ROSI|nr:hypothetical protein Ddye_011327 [Dipteronia dyeriana]